jgi:hypothetical protein
MILCNMLMDRPTQTIVVDPLGKRKVNGYVGGGTVMGKKGRNGKVTQEGIGEGTKDRRDGSGLAAADIQPRRPQ